MEQKIFRYIRSHTMTTLIAVLSVFLLLFLGEFLLYRRIMFVNQIVSEGLMQIKEATKTSPSPTIIIRK